MTTCLPQNGRCNGCSSKNKTTRFKGKICFVKIKTTGTILLTKQETTRVPANNE